MVLGMIAGGWVPVWANGVRGGDQRVGIRRLPVLLEHRTPTVVSGITIGFLQEAVPVWRKRLVCRCCRQLLPRATPSAQ